MMNSTASITALRRWLLWLRRGLLYLLLMAAIVSGVDWLRSRDVPQALPALTVQAIGQPPQDVVALSQTQPVILYFWASWCGVCPLVSPTVDRFAQQHPVLAVALSSGSDEQLQQYVRHKDYAFAVVNDHRGHLATQFGIKATPTLVIVYQGQVRAVTSGLTSWPGLWLRLWLTKTLN